MLEMTELTRTYLRHTAVDHVSLTLKEGKTYALLGPNGSGKTTLMKMIAGLTKLVEALLVATGIALGTGVALSLGRALLGVLA